MTLFLSLLKDSKQLQTSFWADRSIRATLPRHEPSKDGSMTRGSRHCMLPFLLVQISTALLPHPIPSAELCRVTDFPYIARFGSMG